MVPERRNSHTIDDLMKPPKGFPVTSITSLREFEARKFQYVFMNFDGNPCVYGGVLDGHYSCNVIVIKTCNEMEAPYVDFLRSQFQKPVLLIGPLVLVSEPPSGELDDRWSKWLSLFPAKSVILCSFGSETFINGDQIKKLALGLELSVLPFLLVLNFPANVIAQTESTHALLEGFVERVKDMGVVHAGWVQQQLILAHNSVGCYVCHSGFSSVIEAIMNDCQLVLFPFKGDKFFNAKLMVGDLRAGVEVNRREDNGYFDNEDILKAVKTVMWILTRRQVCVLEQIIRNGENSFRIQNKFIADLVKELKVLA